MTSYPVVHHLIEGQGGTNVLDIGKDGLDQLVHGIEIDHGAVLLDELGGDMIPVDVLIEIEDMHFHGCLGLILEHG